MRLPRTELILGTMVSFGILALITWLGVMNYHLGKRVESLEGEINKVEEVSKSTSDLLEATRGFYKEYQGAVEIMDENTGIYNEQIAALQAQVNKNTEDIQTIARYLVGK